MTAAAAEEEDPDPVLVPIREGADRADSTKDAAVPRDGESPPQRPAPPAAGAADAAAAVRRSFRSASRTSRRSSLELRKVPSHILLGAETSTGLDLDSRFGGSDAGGDGGGKVPVGGSRCGRWAPRRAACLLPNHSLRRQMMLSFGLVSAATIFTVMAVSVAVSVAAGDRIKVRSRENLGGWAEDRAGVAARYVAEAFAPAIPANLAGLLHELTLDRFTGYPDADGYEDDSLVPFFDVTTGRNRYPLESDPLPLDWQVEANVNEPNHREHVRDRWGWYGLSPRIGTGSAFYGMQGTCDPSETDPAAAAYYPNCTDANNDVSTGGAVAPTPMSGGIARRAADLGPALKALYEHHDIAKAVGVFFSNGGAGSYITFPHLALRTSYVSSGCEWMGNPNPLDPSRPIGTPEEIGRCHPEGSDVPNREYNPLERGWCRDQALDPDRIKIVGPYLDAFTENLWLMTVGRAVYDRVTGEFVACILADVAVGGMVDVLKKKKISDSALVSLVRWDEDGTVVASPNWNLSSATETTTVDDVSLGLGVDGEVFRRMKDIVDFGGTWDPAEVQERYESFVHKSGDGKLVTSYPVPPPPMDAYDPNYRPEFMVILSLDEDDVFSSVSDMEAAVDAGVRSLITFTLIFGLVGLAFIIIVIFSVSLRLTEPLKWMNSVAEEIVDGFGREDGGHGIDVDRRSAAATRCSPRTELTDLVEEFRTMVSRFSGEGFAGAARPRLKEGRNQFTLLDEFEDLYWSRRGFRFDYGLDLPEAAAAAGGGNGGGEGEDGDRAVADVPRRRHFGPNHHHQASETKSAAESLAVDDPAAAGEAKSPLSSPLFRWIVGLVVVPLLVTTVTISAVVTWNASAGLPRLVGAVEAEYVELESRALATASVLRAALASATIGGALRDLHMLTRMAGWLLFGGVRRSGSLTEMTTAGQRCRSAPGRKTCGYYDEMPCDCAWNDRLAGIECRDYDGLDSRYLQRQHFEGQRQDALPNGDRNFTSFPDVDYAPNATAWWDDVTTVPGHEKGASAAGHDTTYDRLKVISALSAIQLPLYNHYTGRDRSLGTYVAFEADGMIVGYAGCNHGHADYPFWKCSDDNCLFEERPEICQEGKYGYDARCRDWYATGKKMWEERRALLYCTPPYAYASNQDIKAQSCGSPLVDPKTGEHVGQTLIDFLPQSIFDLLSSRSTPLARGGFPILITARNDTFGADTVVGPGFSWDGPSRPIEEVVLPLDHNCGGGDCSKLRAFEEIADEMRAGGAGSANFTRTRGDGAVETIHMSYAPVTARGLRPLDSSDFSRGVEEDDSLIYSLALAQPEDSLLEPFQAVKDSIHRQVNISIGVLSALIAVATVLVVLISYHLTMSISTPILRLLTLIRNMNRLKIRDEFPPLTEYGGSKEVLAVYDTFEMLYKVVRFANSAFYHGELEEAYWVLHDSLRLFKRLDNKKAIGVVNNNLGNTMLTMYRAMEASEVSTICGMSKEQIVARGTAYFRDTIKSGEEAYDKFYEEEGWSTNCLGFMQHLSNRYFNRGMFLLTVRGDHKRPDEAERLGFRDLEIARDMDIEVADQFVEIGFAVDKVERFDLMLSRIRGLLALVEMSYPADEDLEETIFQAFRDLKAALRGPSNGLFDDVTPAGRMQQLDAELIRYAKVRGDSTEAARVGVRMLVEDEYIWLDANIKAVEALVHHLDVEEDGSPDDSAADLKEQLLALRDSLQTQTLDLSLRQYPSVKSSSKRTSSVITKSSRRASSKMTRGQHSRLLRESCRGDVTMEMF